MKNVVVWSQGNVSTVEDIQALGVSQEQWDEYMDLLQHVLFLSLSP